MKRTNEKKFKRTKKRTNIKTNKKVYWFLSFFVSLSFVSLLVFGLTWWSSGWNGKNPLNIVVSSGENLWVVYLRPEEKQALEVFIPPTAIVEIPGRGKWQARALWEVSRLEKDPSLAAAAGWNLLQIPIDVSLRFSDWKSARPSYASLFSGDWRNVSQELKILKFLKS